MRYLYIYPPDLHFVCGFMPDGVEFVAETSESSNETISEEPVLSTSHGGGIRGRSHEIILDMYI